MCSVPLSCSQSDASQRRTFNLNEPLVASIDCLNLVGDNSPLCEITGLGCRSNDSRLKRRQLMFARTKNLVTVAAITTCLVSVTGCTNSTDPAESTASVQSTRPSSTTPSVKPTPSPTPKPTPTPVPASSSGPAKNWPVPQMPDVAKEKSEAGIVAFTKYYFELAEYTINTNQSAPLRKMTLQTCTVCGESFIDIADNNKKAGAWFVGAPFNPIITKAVLSQKNGVVALVTQQGEMTAYMSDGTLQGVFPASQKPDPATMLLTWDEGWKVESLEYLDEN